MPAFLAFLICPLVMGAMMWWMMRGHRQTPSVTPPSEARHGEDQTVDAPIEARGRALS